ncbi:dienelactone hydrolase family protein [Salmonella enterica]|nr:dienelactone hydrolase family protein [Salmonella enterica]EIA0034532.1 dienelactone hydrolase family protein [Salmonella enterica]
MLKLIENNENAVVVLHEIYGINEHIKDVCAEYHDRGFDVYCPHLFEHGLPFKYGQQDQAYKNFVNTCGFDTTKINLLLSEIRGGYKKIIMIGFSVGATIAWLSAESNLCDGIVCYYGSRIRDYTDIMPQCPVLVIMAQFEKSFDPYVLHAYSGSK